MSVMPLCELPDVSFNCTGTILILNYHQFNIVIVITVITIVTVIVINVFIITKFVIVLLNTIPILIFCHHHYCHKLFTQKTAFQRGDCGR